jgi:HAMP domain-containing protein
MIDRQVAMARLVTLLLVIGVVLAVTVFILEERVESNTVRLERLDQMAQQNSQKTHALLLDIQSELKGKP